MVELVGTGRIYSLSRDTLVVVEWPGLYRNQGNSQDARDNMTTRIECGEQG